MVVRRVLLVSIKVATTMIGLIYMLVVYLISHHAVSSIAPYGDDSDYDYRFHDTIPTNYEWNTKRANPKESQDDFYVILDNDDLAKSENQKNNIYPVDNELPTIFTSDDESVEETNSHFYQLLNWYKLSKKQYRYTKHRIPEYDYDELDFVDERQLQECDERSIWTHCLCQFTCSNPDIVDCYAPCTSGCECKEDYVFDKKTQRCLLPEQCSSNEDYFIFEK